eukprot:CAMPEP_0196598926 /NCGR_PEP_ID=MMETSP1081-20130531/94585_1 /TAXON_ID=36882 /ORGANISM="Pyramimonas amylifera, Strain CCMP720" /LENGTH=424 /DNA_ID=CAMNT_0041924663 /DNA_START=345 /DNA_END=1619 /DNA_ORIENTATION=-
MDPSIKASPPKFPGSLSGFPPNFHRRNSETRLARKFSGVGVQVIGEIRKIEAAHDFLPLPVVCIGAGSKGDRELSIHLGANGFLAIPSMDSELVRTTKSWVTPQSQETLGCISQLTSPGSSYHTATCESVGSGGGESGGSRSPRSQFDMLVKNLLSGSRKNSTLDSASSVTSTGSTKTFKPGAYKSIPSIAGDFALQAHHTAKFFSHEDRDFFSEDAKAPASFADFDKPASRRVSSNSSSWTLDPRSEDAPFFKQYSFSESGDVEPYIRMRRGLLALESQEGDSTLQAREEISLSLLTVLLVEDPHFTDLMLPGLLASFGVSVVSVSPQTCNPVKRIVKECMDIDLVLMVLRDPDTEEEQKTLKYLQALSDLQDIERPILLGLPSRKLSSGWQMTYFDAGFEEIELGSLQVVNFKRFIESYFKF